MKEYPFISIVIPAKNEEVNITKCLDSVLFNDYPKECYEVIVMDNGSSDRTVQISKQSGAKVFVYPEMTISGLRNEGVKKAKGNIIAFLDADCIVSVNWLRAAVANFGNEQIIACGNIPTVIKNATWVQKTWEFNVTNDKERALVGWLSSMNIFVKKDVFLKVKGFDESLVTCEDVDLCYRLRHYGEILSDKKIEVTHLGEPKNLREFFHKERWRGQDNFSGIFKHGIVLGEIPTLIMPIYITILFGFGAFSVLSCKIILLLFSVLSFIIPAFVLAIKKSLAKKEFKYFFKLIFLYLIFFVARTLAIFIKSKHKSENITA